MFSKPDFSFKECNITSRVKTPVQSQNRIYLVFFLVSLFFFNFSFFEAHAASKLKRTSNIPAPYKQYASGIGFLKNGRYLCTAFCISENAIATSQHCVRNNQKWKAGSFNSVFSVEHNRKVLRSKVYGTDRQSRRASIAFGIKRSPGFRYMHIGRLKWGDADWAFIKLQKNVCHSILPIKELVGLASRTLPGRDDAVMISADRFIRQGRGKRLMFSGKCRFFEPNSPLPGGAIAHNCGSIPGTSGSPLILKDDAGNLVVVAINSGSLKVKDYKTKKKKRYNYAASASLYGNAVEHFVSHDQVSDPGKIKALQASLVKLRLLDGKVDGVYGPATRIGIYRFENTIGLPELGLPSELIYDLLVGNREVPKSCYRGSMRGIYPPECRNLGLPAN